MAFVYVKHVINTPQTSLFTCRNCVFIREPAECPKQRETGALNARGEFSVFSVYLQPKTPTHCNTNKTLRAAGNFKKEKNVVLFCFKMFYFICYLN